MTAPHEDFRLSPAERAASLLGLMTLREKCHQLTGVMPWSFVRADGSDAPDIDGVLQTGPGHVSQLILDDAEQLARTITAIQSRAIGRTRLGIPVLFHAEAIAGFLAGGHMVFPSGTGVAATFSPDLTSQTADLIRRQMRRVGISHALAPVLDVANDPRWGRFHETYGEDPYLAATMGVAYVAALQGEDLRDGVIATGKHFLGYAAPAGGLNKAQFEAGSRRTREIYAFPFEAAIRRAGLRSVMNSYNTVDGIPVGGSRAVLTDLLRTELGFDGFVSSDYATTDKLINHHRVARDAGAAARLAIRAGLDVELPRPLAYGDVLVAEVESGRVASADVDASVFRVLRAKFEVGLFEHPYPAEGIEAATVEREGAELSLELARRSVVLLQNDGVLPLDGGCRIALIGPHADTVARFLPTYTHLAYREGTDAARAQRATMAMVGAEDVQADWFDGAFVAEDWEASARRRFKATSIADELRVAGSAQLEFHRGSELRRPLSADERESAVQAAARSDVTVLVLGGTSLWYSGERTEGEASDSADISLPAAQVGLADEIAAVAPRLVVVVLQGRPYVLPESVNKAAALVISPYSGPYGPRAVADVLRGVVNPSGRLPYSIPRHAGQVPVYHHQNAGSGYRSPTPPHADTHYIDAPATPQWPFGAGQSYTTFALGEPTVDSTVSTDGVLHVSLDVTNTGPIPGATVVQLYARVDAEGVTRPAQKLIGFARVDLPAGHAAGVLFDVPAEQFGYIDTENEFAVHPGDVTLFLGSDAHDRTHQIPVAVTGRRRPIPSSEREFLSSVLVAPMRAVGTPATGSEFA